MATYVYKTKREKYRFPLNQGTTTITSFAPMTITNKGADGSWKIVHDPNKWPTITRSRGEHRVSVWVSHVTTTSFGAIKSAWGFGTTTAAVNVMYITVTTPNAPVQIFDNYPLFQVSGGEPEKLLTGKISTTNGAFAVFGYATIWE